uniref:Zinc-finger domain-containing protein n=2 Tax=Candidatus Bipolaricaulota TaxID=67810 RepID=H5SMN1_9BACT|nr:hypothetical protein HGMM_F50D11C26 [uncultured Acetothermia bacterium]BAL59799.1 hypothetical protein HGMM_OP4C435 [Candidatus Acetothermum autotrophicum]
MSTEYSESELNHENLAEFADLAKGLEMGYENHPSEEILRAYVANRLLDGPGAGRVSATFRNERAFEQFLQGRLARWTRADVSMHILTCARCQQSVWRLRTSRWHLLASAREHSREEQRWYWRFAFGALAGAAVAAIAVALWLWPSSPPHSACWIEEQCWQQVVRDSPTKGSILTVYRATPGRF